MNPQSQKYCDANNLYGFCQQRPLPCGNFKFEADPEKIGMDIIERYNDNDKTEYIFKVDLVRIFKNYKT